MSGKKEEIESLTLVLGEVVLRPLITPEEVENARRTVEYENQAMRMMPPPDNILTEMIHKVRAQQSSDFHAFLRLAPNQITSFHMIMPSPLLVGCFRT